jgi:hypothetical protein
MFELIKESSWIAFFVGASLLVLTGGSVVFACELFIRRFPKICTKCKGVGSLYWLRDWDKPPDKQQPLEKPVPCPDCNGTGKVY